MELRRDWNFFPTRFSSLEYVSYRHALLLYCFTKGKKCWNIESLEISFSFMHGNKCARGPISPLPRVNGYSFMDHVGNLFQPKNSWERYDDEVYKYRHSVDRDYGNRCDETWSERRERKREMEIDSGNCARVDWFTTYRRGNCAFATRSRHVGRSIQWQTCDYEQTTSNDPLEFVFIYLRRLYLESLERNYIVDIFALVNKGVGWLTLEFSNFQIGSNCWTRKTRKCVIDGSIHQWAEKDISRVEWWNVGEKFVDWIIE